MVCRFADVRLYYRSETGRPMRVAWALEEFGVPYELRLRQRSRLAHADELYVGAEAAGVDAEHTVADRKLRDGCSDRFDFPCYFGAEKSHALGGAGR